MFTFISIIVSFLLVGGLLVSYTVQVHNKNVAHIHKSKDALSAELLELTEQEDFLKRFLDQENSMSVEQELNLVRIKIKKAQLDLEVLSLEEQR